ncbi:MAG: Gfo/Idh/MocA family oxidoreductase [Chloroherpetonaceae bacterium]|nr:Gfo/Idh/MocA family oxidoreductase [Chloroherpetonaceae bacterium]
MSALETVRVGIVGPSWWVDYWHLVAIKAHPQAEIVAVCGERPRALAEVQSQYGTSARYFTRYEDMLEQVSLDGVIVCTPNDLHYPVTMAALHRGLHVHCEKPLALNAAQAREMAQTARARGLIGMTNFPYRDNPCVQRMRQMLSQGAIGTPLHIVGSYSGGFGLLRPPNWRGWRDRSGAGILGDLGSHLIDLARFVTGQEFRSVCAHTLTALWSGEGLPPQLVRTEDSRAGNRNDDACAFLAGFDTGMQGVFHTSWVAEQGHYRQEQILEVCGTRGRLRFTATHGGTCLQQLRAEPGRWEVIPVAGTVRPDEADGEDEDYFRPGRHTPSNTTYRWIEAIRTGAQQVSPDLEDGWRAQQVIDAVLRASAEQRWIDVEV